MVQTGKPTSLTFNEIDLECEYVATDMVAEDWVAEANASYRWVTIRAHVPGNWLARLGVRAGCIWRRWRPDSQWRPQWGRWPVRERKALVYGLEATEVTLMDGTQAVTIDGDVAAWCDVEVGANESNANCQ